MLTEWELWAVADTVIRQHGQDVEGFIAKQIDALELRGDQDGISAWRQIGQRVAQLTAEPPARLDS